MKRGIDAADLHSVSGAPREASAAEDASRPDPRYAIPELRAVALRRQRLLDFLYENVDHPLQLVCAPAGYGKTTLLADFARDTDLTVCWYTVDELDLDPLSFLRHLGESISSRFPSFDGSAEPAYHQSTDPDIGWQSEVNRLVDLIDRHIAEYFVLLIDDFHLVSASPGVIGAADLLVQRLPDNCRLIISAREIPQVASLPRLISQRRVSGLGAAELKFTADEIKTLLKNSFDLEVTSEEARRLEDESEGWVTAILLTTHSLWKGLFREVLKDRGQHSLLFEYIASEVFSQQPPSIQRFLLSTSICNKFDISLANTLTGIPNTASVLEEVEFRNLFLTRLGSPDPWYSYHHLFRDFLRERLEKGDPTRFVALNVEAAEHHVSAGEPREAIYYYIQASEFERALDLIEDLAEPLSHEGLWETLGTWLDRIPEESRAGRPRTLVYQAQIYRFRGKVDEAIHLLSDAIDVFREQGESLLEAQALIRRGASLRSKGAYQMAIRDARAALKLAREHGAAVDQADAHHNLGSAFFWQGKFHRAEKEFRAALQGYQEHGDLFQLSEINDRLGGIYVELGDSSRAMTHFERARQGWKKLGNQYELSVTLNNMSVLYYYQALYDVAEPLAIESISLAQTTRSPKDEAYALMTLSDIQRERGEYAESLSSCQKSLGLARQCMETHLVGYGSFAMGETYRLLGERQKAKSVLHEALALAAEHDQDFELGLGLTSRGIIEYDERNYQQSEGTLKAACEALIRSGHKRALARASLHLAQALFLSKKYVAALEQMEAVSRLCGELGYDRFLVPDARRLYLLVQYAADRSKVKDFFVQLGEQINERPPLQTASEFAQTPPPQRSTIAFPRVDVSSLGSLKVSLDGNPVVSSAWGSSKAREMFLFMLRAGHPLNKEKIVEALWPEIAPSKANSNFHSTLYRVRTALLPNCVDRDGELYRLNPAWTYWWDAQEFQRLVTEADRQPEDGVEAERYLDSAIELYGGPFAEEIDSEWCDELRIELELKFLRIVQHLAERREAAGEYHQSIDLLQTALAVDEQQEEIYYKVMDLYLKLGDRAAAARVYRRCLSVFGETTPLSHAPETKGLLSRLN